MEDITNSRIDIFSINGNVTNDHFLLETTKLSNDNIEDDEKYLSNINILKKNSKNSQKLILKKKIVPKIKKINTSNIIDTSNESSIKINNEENDDDYDDIENNFLTNGKIHSSNNFFLKKNLSTNANDYFINGNYSVRNTDFFQSIDNCYSTFAYGPLNSQSLLESKSYFLDNNNIF